MYFESYLFSSFILIMKFSTVSLGNVSCTIFQVFISLSDTKISLFPSTPSITATSSSFLSDPNISDSKKSMAVTKIFSSDPLTSIMVKSCIKGMISAFNCLITARLDIGKVQPVSQQQVALTPFFS